MTGRTSPRRSTGLTSTGARWARRQAHESELHRADAKAAPGESPAFTPEFALDGIAELREGFYARPGGKLLADPPTTLRVAPALLGWSNCVPTAARSPERRGRRRLHDVRRGERGLPQPREPSGRSVTVDGNPRAIEIRHRLARVRWS